MELYEREFFIARISTGLLKIKVSPDIDVYIHPMTRDQDFEAAEVSDKSKDRLNIDKGVPQKTAWMVTEENKETSEPKQEKKQEKKQEPKYPFPEDAYPIHAFFMNDKKSKLRFRSCFYVYKLK